MNKFREYDSIKSIFNTISSGLVVFQSDEEQGLLRLCQIIKNLPSDKKVSGVFESIDHKNFSFQSSQVNLKKGIHYPQLISVIEVSKSEIVVIENPRDKESLTQIFELIERSSCIVLAWIRGPGQDPSFVKNLLFDLGFQDKYIFEFLKAIIYQDLSVHLKVFKDPL